MAWQGEEEDVGRREMLRMQGWLAVTRLVGSHEVGSQSRGWFAVTASL